MNDADLQQLARRRVKAKRDFTMHLIVYLIINAGLIAIWAATGRGYPWFIWPLIGWGVAVLANAAAVAMELYLPEERAVDREMRRLRP